MPQSLFKMSGFGTEKVESETARFFPGARIARLDADTMQKRGSHQDILDQFRNKKIDILIGTQMIAKGFDFAHVTLVGVILADNISPEARKQRPKFGGLRGFAVSANTAIYKLT